MAEVEVEVAEDATVGAAQRAAGMEDATVGTSHRVYGILRMKAHLLWKMKATMSLSPRSSGHDNSLSNLAVVATDGRFQNGLDDNPGMTNYMVWSENASIPVPSDTDVLRGRLRASANMAAQSARACNACKRLA